MFSGAPLEAFLEQNFDSPSQLCDLADNAEDLGRVLSEDCASLGVLEQEVQELWNWLKPFHRRKRAKLRELGDRCAIALLRGEPQRGSPGVSAEAGIAEGWVIKGRRKKWPSRLRQCKQGGDRQRRDAEDVERARWGAKLVEYMMEMDYPVADAVNTGKVTRDVATHSLLGLRAGTLRLRARRWEKFRAWLLHVKGRSTPTTIYEVAEYIQDLSRNGCGKTVPQDVLNALFTVERLGDVQPNDSWASRSYLKNQVKEAELVCATTTDDVKRAPPFCVVMIAAWSCLW